MNPVDESASMQIIADWPMMEVGGNDGAVYITSSRAESGAAKPVSLEIHEIESIRNK